MTTDAATPTIRAALRSRFGTDADAPADPLAAEIAARIGAAFEPDVIVLYGSRARGDHDDDSDIDLLVVVPDSEHRIRDAAAMRCAVLDIEAAMDIAVVTRADVERWAGVSGTVLDAAMDEGRVVYERP